ncbi:unnamed protein product (macronuclear) [Paramecium tetraurelia]|uniref:HotDog ACOT-type domain-containing protein n=1 Tax=Paramecium tetraurelia TaxID=5888 RepID=A0CP63_PARTE|nr:uncharacterized protein GSPATT00008971001 [Paramecium tetraurelia]CAK72580.1 unnamed protein product [Paramecium tetraurelia]|eukprot:XP_001439977.1 hypothetical protein (macronuclear) [Paramecium tetraurelia strain d4-2]
MLYRKTLQFLSNQVARSKLGQLQYQGIMMKVPSQMQKEENSEEDRLVKAFFTKNHEQIKVYGHSQREPNEKSSSPRNSWYKVVLPFKSNPELSFKFRRFYTNQVRIGRLLELMDYIASTVSYNYILPSSGATMVTAMVDNINFFGKISADQDLEIQGYVTYVGNSSIEVYIDVMQEGVVNVSANFLMVARDGKDHSKAYKVPTMDLNGESDKETAELRCYLGKHMQDKRKLQKDRSLDRKAPSQEEINELHKFFMNPPSDITIDETQIEKTLLMHIQDRNLHGKVFGGFVMREAFELGWLNAYLHVKGQGFPQIIHIDDIQFLAPVDIGSALQVQSRITAVKDTIMHVEVNCYKISPNQQKIRSNDLHLTLNVPGIVIPQVQPKTYNEGMQWLNACRRMNYTI